MQRGGRGRGRGAGMKRGYPSYDYSSGYGGYDAYGYGYDSYGFGGYDSTGFATGGRGGYVGGDRSALTNSSDPESKKSRVFVGNLNTRFMTKEDLSAVFSKFGTPLAISIHKGFAFVQFATETEARSAVSYTDQMEIGGQTVDTNVASEPKQRGADGTMGPSLNNGVGADKFTCGNCSTAFHSLSSFKKHRLQQCEYSAMAVDPGALTCYQCSTGCGSAWDLVEHLRENHNTTLYATG